MEAAQEMGILKRMTAIGEALRLHLPKRELAKLMSPPSDTVRGWWCFAMGADSDVDDAGLLERCRPMADDSHFGVREWVWMAMRPRLTRDLTESIDLLIPWTAKKSENLR